MRTMEQHHRELSDTWVDIHEQIRAGKAPTTVEVRELVLELLTFNQRHHERGAWITKQCLSDFAKWLDHRLETEPPEKSGLKDRRLTDYHRIRYCLVGDLVAAGVTGRKPGRFPQAACKTAAAILRYLDHPAGRARGGAGDWVNARAIKDSCRRAEDAPDAWALADDDIHKIELSDGLIAAVSE